MATLGIKGLNKLGLSNFITIQDYIGVIETIHNNRKQQRNNSLESTQCVLIPVTTFANQFRSFI